MYQINKWAFQWKKSFDSDLSKQEQEIIFSRKTKKISHPSWCFNISIVSQTPYQKHLDIFLDARLTFEEHLRVITTKANKTIGPLRKDFAKTGINDHIQSFCEITVRIWPRNLWWSLRQNISTESWIYSI